MTLEQVMWARGHDWFVCAVPDTKGDWKVHVRFKGYGEPLRFSNYQALREWAGY